MLRNVHLRNLALIKEAEIEFDKGLNILTGETGAGKSIILGSINIALGDKASKSFIRNGADFGLVELLFTTQDPRVFRILASLDIPVEEDQILISRRITPESSTSRINGVTVTLANLRAVTSLLVDIHGQHDHQSLLNPAKHLVIVDGFAAGNLAISSAPSKAPQVDAQNLLNIEEQADAQEFPANAEQADAKEDMDAPSSFVPSRRSNAFSDLRLKLHKEYNAYKSLRNEYRAFSQNPQELSKERSFLEFEMQEIADAALKDGEDAALEAEFRRLSNAGKIHDGLQKVRSELFDLSDSASGRISDALREMNYLMGMEPSLKSCMDSLMDLDSICRDLNHDLSHFLEENAFSEERYHEVHQRLDEINRLKSKYGQSISDILTYQGKLEDRLADLEHFSSRRADLVQQMDVVRTEVNHLATSLSDLRKEAASRLEAMIRENLADLNFLNADFRIDFQKADKIYQNGFDKVEFLLSTNVGEPVKPLVKVASGGELSRVMLAIKASVADADQTDTLIFDEIDTGISGRTAQKVAEKMAVLSTDHQLICITHLPQIAAMADSHFAIEKSVDSGSTISGIRKLSHADSILELARLISGSEITEITIKNAEEMKAAKLQNRMG